jgi:IS30 family transposase
MTNYYHLSQEQRYQMEALLRVGKSQKDIALQLGCHKSTVSRELKRNMPHRGRGALNYQAAGAQEKTRLRHHFKPKREKFTPDMRKQIIPWMRVNKFSPELISVLGRRENPDFVSAETIYKWIYEMKHSTRREHLPFQSLYRDLKQAKRQRKRGNHRDSRNKLLNRISIEKRPALVEKRKRLGDLEVDLMLGKNHQAGVLVIVDRASLKTSLTKLTNKESKNVTQAIIRKMKPWKRWLKTMTYDNDMSFAGHSKVNCSLNVKSFFTHPYSSQEKGTVENRIGVLRRFFPKGQDLTDVSPQRIRQVEALLNERPVRKFNYQTPNAVFLQKLELHL